MVIGILTVSISIPQANSLKDKRRVVKSIKDRLRNGFNVSVAEIGEQDIWRTALLGIAVISEDATYANGVLSRVQDLIQNNRDAIMTSCELEWR
ncbi:MAG TPA: DUF503 domain-containing protein [candidate division Zixibacteria bacterium]|nr:DUF503 domain-containing protein [candidate division Zixibacteria bacterium]